jgi:hypothetical protein
MLARFEREVLEAAAARGQTLTPEETAARVRSARRAYFARLSLASSLVRSRRNKMADTDVQDPVSAMEVRRASGELPTES